MTLEEKFKIATEFDDAISWDKKRELWFNKARNNNSGGWQEYLTYNTDYNELHRVWVKFRDLKFSAEELSDRKDVWKSIVSHYIINDTIEKAFEMLVEAIVWVNSIPTKTS